MSLGERTSAGEPVTLRKLNGIPRLACRITIAKRINKLTTNGKLHVVQVQRIFSLCLNDVEIVQVETRFEVGCPKGRALGSGETLTELTISRCHSQSKVKEESSDKQ